MYQSNSIAELKQLCKEHLPDHTDLINAIDEKLKFEMLISDLSAKFSSIKEEDIENEIEEGLRMIVKFLNLDRSTLFSLSEEESQFIGRYSFARKGLPLIKTKLGAELFPNIFSLLLKNEIISFYTYNDLPGEFEKDIQSFKSYQLAAGFIVPITFDQKIKYALAGGLIEKKTKNWSTDLLPRIQFLGEILAGAIERLETKKAVRSGKEAMQVLMNASTETTILIDTEGRFLTINKFGAERLGKSTEQLIGTSMYDLFSSSLKEQRKARVEEVIQTKKPVRFFDEREGIIFDNNLYPLFDSSGNVIKIAIFGRDITKEQQFEQELKDSETRYRFIFEQGPVGIGLIDKDFFWIKANPRFCDMLGYTEDELKTLRWTDITHPDDLKRDVQQAEQVFKGELPFFTTEKRFFKKNGDTIWVSLTPTAIKDNNDKILYALGMMLDITEKKIAEENLQKALSQIKDLKDQLDIENIYLKEEIKSIHGFENIIGKSLPLNYVLQRLKSVAPTDATVLVEGETGTGKELIARAIHNESLRKNKPLIKVGCAALSSSLIESELFGHEKGAFTGANTTRIGRFELADKSTLFLDEIGELSFELQAKLLRVIQEGEFERLGSSKTIKVDVRIITATNRNLEAEMKKRNFREDLYYRLSSFIITVPPLRERRDDIPLLAKYFIDQYSKKMGKRIRATPRSTMKNLEKYSWPGNIRELQNVIEHAIIISEKGVLKFDLPAYSDIRHQEKMKLDDIERDHILKVLNKTNWRIAGKGGAAELLGLKRTTLQSRMKKLGIKMKK